MPGLKTRSSAFLWETVMGFTKKGWQDAAVQWYRPFTFETLWGAKTISERPIAEWIKTLICGYGREK